MPDGVYAEPTGDLGASFFADSRIAASGRHSLRLRTARADQGVRVSLTRRATGGTPNATQLSLSLRALTHAPSATLAVSLSSRGFSPSCCDDAAPTPLTWAGGDTLAFQELSVAFQLPPDCASVTWCEPSLMLATAGATAWIDDVVMEIVE